MSLTILISLIAASLPLIYWLRFGNARLDRDYAPYAYCGVFKSGYLKGGHRDVKPPLIHWGYRVWLGIISKLTLSQPMKIRLLPLLAGSFTYALLSFAVGPKQTFILALLLCSPYLWPHMANTEWMTVSVVALCIVANPTYAWVLLGLLPLINQKNVLLIVPVALALGLDLTPIIPNALALSLPSLIVLIYLAATKRLSMVKTWLWDIPKRMGKRRSFRANTLSVLHLLIPFFYKLALILCIVDYKSPWFMVLLVVMGMTIAVKQIVPHHFILWALPLAMCANPTPLFFVGFAILWLLQDYPIWKNPALLYPLTFRFRNSGGVKDYGMLLSDADEAIDWVKANTAPGEPILVNGIENSFYLDANRPASAMQICEAQQEEESILPRVIVHSAATAKEIPMDGYEHVLITPMGLYSVFKRKELTL